MQVIVQVEFKAERREPLGVLIRRVAAQFRQAGVLPTMVASFTEGPCGMKISAINRALKKHPQLAALEREDAPLARMPSVRRLTNHGTPHAFSMEDVLALADGVPRSLPFHDVTVQFRHADFGQATAPTRRPSSAPGITIQDSWWVNGRTRSLSALYSVDVDAAAKKMPDPPASIGSILAGFGKPRRSRQVFLKSSDTTAPAESGAAVHATEHSAIAPIVDKYRSEMRSLIERASLPYDLPPENEARRTNLGASGALKPTLVQVFGSRGFDCLGGNGIFTLQHRTGGNHVVELKLDVGTWSRSVMAMFRVRGPGYNATLELPVTIRAQRRQYPIGDVENWERIVANLAMIVDELERTFVSGGSRRSCASVVQSWARLAVRRHEVIAGDFATGRALADYHRCPGCRHSLRRVIGGGESQVQAMLSGDEAFVTIGIMFTVRLVLGPLSYAPGLPDGLFAPLLVIGAAAGLLFGRGLEATMPALTPPLAALAAVGMGALFTAVVGAPVTGIALVVEMTGATTLFVPLLTACAGALAVPALLGSRPIYDTLRDRDAARCADSTTL